MRCCLDATNSELKIPAISAGFAVKRCCEARRSHGQKKPGGLPGFESRAPPPFGSARTTTSEPTRKPNSQGKTTGNSSSARLTTRNSAGKFPNTAATAPAKDRAARGGRLRDQVSRPLRFRRKWPSGTRDCCIFLHQAIASRCDWRVAIRSYHDKKSGRIACSATATSQLFETRTHQTA